MLTLKEYIINEKDNYGNPDHISHHDKIYDYDSKYAVAFIYNISNDMCIWSEPGKTHNDILFDLDSKTRKKMNLYVENKPVRYVEWLSEYDLDKENKCGRIWVIPNNVSKHRKYDVYIAWWDLLDDYNFVICNKTILKKYNEKFHIKLESCIAIDNNGKFILFTPEDDKIVLDKTDKSRVEDLSILKWIHLTTQKEKKDYLYSDIKERDIKFQNELYNKTKSKTAAEWHNNKVRKYDPKTGKTYWGEKIGDNYINNTEILNV